MENAGRVLSSFFDVHWPRHSSLDGEGHVLVADYSNHRILLLNSELRLQRVLIDNTNTQVKLWWPRGLSYDELTSQLYVLHNSSSEEWLPPCVVSLFNVR